MVPEGKSIACMHSCLNKLSYISKSQQILSTVTFQTDPFHSVSSLSEDDIKEARNQTIPSLLQLLNLAKQHNISVIFDLYGPATDNDTEDVVKAINDSKIDPGLVSLIHNPLSEFN